MKMRYSWLAATFIIAFSLGASSAIAQEEEEPDCKKPQGHLEIITCVGKAERESDQEMQAIYQKLQQQYQSQEQLPKDHRQKLNYLIKSQEAWLEYRTAHCRWIASSFDGGSMQPIAGVSCQAELNRQRIADLSKGV
jgi:uncharacterized protein YecT (DUF1311 family)